MTVDLNKLVLHSGYNSFKNKNVFRGELTLPNTITTSSNYTDTVTFTMSENASFMQGYMYTSDYQQYFEFLDSEYHDNWRNVNNNNDNMVFLSSDELYYYSVRMKLYGNKVDFTLFMGKYTSGTRSIVHPTKKIPVTFIEYRLTN